MKTIGERLRYARDKKNLKQTQVKERTGINNKTLSGYENGVSEPDSETLKILADLYEVTTDWILGRNEKESDFSLPESEYERVIKEAEKKYGVNLRDDPVVNATLRELILGIAKLKK